jgi:hypothetical protein
MNNLGLNPDPPNPEPQYRITGSEQTRYGRYATQAFHPWTYFLKLMVCCAPMPAERLGHGFRFIAPAPVVAAVRIRMQAGLRTDKNSLSE